MTETAAALCAKFYREARGPERALLVDPSDGLYTALDRAGAEVAQVQPRAAGKPFTAFDLWFGTTPRHYRLVVIARRASSKDLYRVLHLAERLTTSTLAIVCETDVAADHCYQEATEVFLTTHPEYERTLHQFSQVIELKRRP